MLYFTGHKRVKELINEVQSKLKIGILPVVVEIEFFYKSAREYGIEITKTRLISIKQLLISNNVLQEKNSLLIGDIKLKNRSLSFVDAVLVMTAQKEKGKIITTDTPVANVKKISSEKLSF